MSKENSAEEKKMNICNGGITEETIAMWKKQHRKVYAIEVPDPDTDEVFVGYFHHPDMEVMGRVNKLRKTDEVASTTHMFDSCWLGGSEVMKQDALVRIAAIPQLDAIFNRYAGRLKNL